MLRRRPALRAGRRLSTGPPPAKGGRRPHKIAPNSHAETLCIELVLYHFEAKAFLMRRGDGRALTAAASPLRGLAAAQKETLYQVMV